MTAPDPGGAAALLAELIATRDPVFGRARLRRLRSGTLALVRLRRRRAR